LHCTTTACTIDASIREENMSESLSRPLSAAELCEAMRHGRGFDAARLDRILGVDEARGLVEVQAGATWRSLAARLRPGDAQVQASAASTTVPTIGESIARNAAGPDGRPAVSHVESLVVVTPDGELRRVSRQSHPELFALAIGGQGLFGAVYSITLRIGSMMHAVRNGASRPPSAPRSDALRLLVPPEALERFIASVHACCATWRVQIETVQVRPTLPEQETFLRWARRDYREVVLELGQQVTLGASLKSIQLRRELIDAAIALGGSFHISSTPEATRAQTDACYPELRTFLAAKRRFDREERLVNPWYRRQRSLSCG
jgi:hypothetical protein